MHDSKWDRTTPRVAYFCMEYGLHEDFPNYAGGLGILAGDILKTAKDMDYPMVGVGVLWNQGYTNQFVTAEGRVYDSEQDYSEAHLEDTGVSIDLWIRGENVILKVWKTDAFGNVPLYLLDANIAGSGHGWMTKQLYGGVDQDRVAAEMILGIGGVKALRALGLEVDIYHFNEGHPVFAGLELIREKMAKGKSFHRAWQETRWQIAVTIHTPVMASVREYGYDLLTHMGADNGLEQEHLAEIGGSPFHLTAAALRMASGANAVSKQHGLVSRAMWQGVDGAAPIVEITNGVHQQTWQHPQIRQVHELQGNLWKPHMQAKRQLLHAIEDRLGVHLDHDSLTIGFARRAAAYKRLGLIFQRPEIIEPLLRDGTLQLVFAGKAHPQDSDGKEVLSNLIRMGHKFPDSIIFLENYGIELGRLMTAGCDVWLNTPQRPLEASGTSGIKAAMNGVLNLSILDGWWPEGCQHGINGWQIGDGYEGPEQTHLDAASLYKVLLDDVLPVFYEQRKQWVEMMHASITMAVSRFSSERMLNEYYNILYRPPNAMKWAKEEATNLSRHEESGVVTEQPYLR